MAITSTRDEELIKRLVEEDPHSPGPADARVRDYFIHVWALVGDLKNYAFDAKSVSEDHRIPVDYVEAAAAYYRQHPEVIDGRLAANNS